MYTSEFRRQGFLVDPALVYDEEHDLFRFRDGLYREQVEEVRRKEESAKLLSVTNS